MGPKGRVKPGTAEWFLRRLCCEMHELFMRRSRDDDPKRIELQALVASSMARCAQVGFRFIDLQKYREEVEGLKALVEQITGKRAGKAPVEPTPRAN